MDIEASAKFIAGGYRVEAAVNGGFVLFSGAGRSDYDMRPSFVAFSDHGDLTTWLVDAHRELGKPAPSAAA